MDTNTVATVTSDLLEFWMAHFYIGMCVFTNCQYALLDYRKRFEIKFITYEWITYWQIGDIRKPTKKHHAESLNQVVCLWEVIRNAYFQNTLIIGLYVQLLF